MEFLPDRKHGPYLFWNVKGMEHAAVRLSLPSMHVTLPIVPSVWTWEQIGDLMDAMHRMQTYQLAVLDRTRVRVPISEAQARKFAESMEMDTTGLLEKLDVQVDEREKHRPLAAAIEKALMAADDLPYIGGGDDDDEQVGVRIEGKFDMLTAAAHLQAWLDAQAS